MTEYMVRWSSTYCDWVLHWAPTPGDLWQEILMANGAIADSDPEGAMEWARKHIYSLNRAEDWKLYGPGNQILAAYRQLD